MTTKMTIKEYFKIQLLRFRAVRGISQESAAELLGISTRSYSNLEHGKYCLSTRTLMLFFVTISEDEVLRIVREFRVMLKGEKENDVA